MSSQDAPSPVGLLEADDLAEDAWRLLTVEVSRDERLERVQVTATFERRAASPVREVRLIDKRSFRHGDEVELQAYIEHLQAKAEV